MIKLSVGLGNPGKKYQNTRHNIGERIVEEFVKKQNLGAWQRWQQHRYVRVKSVSNGWFEYVFIDNEFMNLAGRPLIEFARFHNIVDAKAIFIIHDELDLPLGTIQIRFGGSAAGHKGVQSVIDHLGTDQFWRCRVGIGKPKQNTEYRIQNTERIDRAVTNYVLGEFSTKERSKSEKVIDEAASLLINWLENEPKTVTKRISFEEEKDDFTQK